LLLAIQLLISLSSRNIRAKTSLLIDTGSDSHLISHIKLLVVNVVVVTIRLKDVKYFSPVEFHAVTYCLHITNKNYAHLNNWIAKIMEKLFYHFRKKQYIVQYLHQKVK